MNDIDVNLLIQTFNEKISSLMTELIIKETTVKQLTAQNKALKDSLIPDELKNQVELKANKKQDKKTDEFE